MTEVAPAKRIRAKGTVEYRHEADVLLEQPGDLVLVDRGRPRSLVISCPDGCGSLLTINLDPRSGKAWRLYRRGDEITLHPSIWRDNGCEAHFVLWRNRLLWCGPRLQGGDEPPYETQLEAAVHAALTNEHRSADEIADALGEIPWEVSRVAERLVKAGKAKLKRVDGAKFFRQAPEPVPPLTRSPPEGLQVAVERERDQSASPVSLMARLRNWLGL